jgi:hypothetical protein
VSKLIQIVLFHIRQKFHNLTWHYFKERLSEIFFLPRAVGPALVILIYTSILRCRCRVCQVIIPRIGDSKLTTVAYHITSTEEKLWIKKILISCQIHACWFKKFQGSDICYLKRAIGSTGGKSIAHVIEVLEAC